MTIGSATGQRLVDRTRDRAQEATFGLRRSEPVSVVDQAPVEPVTLIPHTGHFFGTRWTISASSAVAPPAMWLPAPAGMQIAATSHRATAQMALMHHLPTYLHHELMRFIVARQHASSCHIDKVVRESMPAPEVCFPSRTDIGDVRWVFLIESIGERLTWRLISCPLRDCVQAPCQPPGSDE